MSRHDHGLFCSMVLAGIISLSIGAVLFTADAQITNSGFEDWTTADGHETPSGWVTANSIATGSFYGVTKSTDHYPVTCGNYSARIENNTAFPNDVGRGILASGTVAGIGGPSFPITGHPTSLTGYYKFSPQNGDTMYISIHLYKNGSEVADGYFYSSNSISNWSSFNIPLSTNAPADSGSIMIAAYNANHPEKVPLGNSILYVDNLNFDTLITSGIWQNSKKPHPGSGIATLFNPSSSGVSFTLPSDSRVTLEMVDLRGRKLATLVNNEMMQAGTYVKRLNSNPLSNGVYIYRLRAGSSTETIKAFR